MAERRAVSAPILYGHRGARGEAPENTVAGFLHAIRLGIDGLELDVRLSADRQLVVIHDETVDRTTDWRGKVADLTAEALARLDARAGFAGWPERVGVPTLDQVLAAVAGGPRLAIEIKADRAERLEEVGVRLVATIERHGIADRTTVTSFEPLALQIVGRLAPRLPRAYIGAFDDPSYLGTALRLGCRQVDVPLRTGSPEIVHAARAHGLRVTGWLGNAPEDLRALLDWGVDAITTDYPTMALAYLRAGGTQPVTRS